MDWRQQVAAAAERYSEMARDRKELKRRQKAEGTRVVDTPERVRARAVRLAQAGQLQPEALVKAIAPGEQLEPHVLLERIIDATNDLQAANFLTRGGRAARTVARISYERRGRLVPAGTGGLVGQRLLLTNNHVLPDVATAEQAVAEFNCEIDLDEQTGMVAVYRLDPAALFLTDVHLDYTLVAVQVGADGRAPGQEFGWNRLIAQQGKIAVGEPVNVVGHPMGRLKEIAIRNNSLQTLLDEFLHYATDTEPGNSGSPVFNDQWEYVALHHSGVPRTDADGNWLKRDGSRWRPQDGDDAIDWIANEGARVSVLLRHMADQPLSDGQRAVLAELGAQALPTEASTAIGAPTDGSATPVEVPVAQPTPVRPESTVVTEATAGLVARRAPLGGRPSWCSCTAAANRARTPTRCGPSGPLGWPRGWPWPGDPRSTRLMCGSRSMVTPWPRSWAPRKPWPASTRWPSRSTRPRPSRRVMPRPGRCMSRCWRRPPNEPASPPRRPRPWVSRRAWGIWSASCKSS
jgi:V8-like Glu-specific endopeptidase